MMATFENGFSLCWVSFAILGVLSALTRLAKIHFEKPWSKSLSVK